MNITSIFKPSCFDDEETQLGPITRNKEIEIDSPIEIYKHKEFITPYLDILDND